MVLETGSLILANYTAKIKDTGEIIETTLEEEAKKLGVYDPSRKYEPRLISVGDGWVLKGLDEALASAGVGDRLTVELLPEKAFGERDSSKVRLIPIRKFGEKAADLFVGGTVEIDDKAGVVRSMGSGRVQVDFNHRLAGKVLIYDVEIIKMLDDDDSKVDALLKRRLPIEVGQISSNIEDGIVRIRLPSDYIIEGVQVAKKALSSDIFKFLEAINKVVFIEEYEAPKPNEEVKPKEESPKTEAAVDNPSK